MNNKLRRWLRSVQEEEGSMIVEASLIFPVIFYCTLAILFFGMLIYQTVLSSHAAALARNGRRPSGTTATRRQ